MADDGCSRLARWLASTLTVLLLVTMLFCYLWLQVAVELIRTSRSDFVTHMVTIEAIASSLVALMISLPLALVWHLGDWLGCKKVNADWAMMLCKQRLFLLSLTILITVMGYYQARHMQTFANDPSFLANTMPQKGGGLLGLLLCPALCFGKVLLSICSPARFRPSA